MAVIFCLDNYHSLLDKCISEKSQLQNEKNNPSYDYCLINLIFGLNHIFEWFILDENNKPADIINCINAFNPYEPTDKIPCNIKPKYQLLVNSPLLNTNQFLVRTLCNNFKHFKKKLKFPQNDNKQGQTGYGEFGYGEKGYGDFTHYTYSIEYQGKETEIENIVYELLSSWKSFVEKIEK